MSARVALLVTLLSMGVALLLTAASSRRAVQRAADTLARGQAESFEQDLREHLRDVLPPFVDSDLEPFLEAQTEQGLRYVALVGAEGRLLAEAGETDSPPLSGPIEPGVNLVTSEGLVRLTASPPRRPRADRPPREDFRDRRGDRRRRDGRRPPRDAFDPFPPPPPPRGERDDGPPRPREPNVVLEFEPLVAAELERQATRTLWLGAVAAVALTAAALVFWRLLSLRERDERRLAEQRRLASLGEMSAVLAHEIRNPLASLKGHAQLLAERLPEAAAERRGAERVIGEAKRLEQLATSLLDFVRTASVQTEPSSPAAILKDCVEQVGAGRVDVEDESAPAVWPLDALRVRQVLRNLIENAVQASPEDARVDARCSTAGGRLIYEIRDRGTGLPQGDPEKLFEPFHTTRTTGTGLGLAVAKRVVELHGGSIHASNDPQGGARFRVELPKPSSKREA